MNATTVVIDLAKDVFELGFADAQGRMLRHKRLRRTALLRTFENQAPLTIVIEACGSAHYWARRWQAMGHTVQMLPAQHCRPFVRGNKTDRSDVAGLLLAHRIADLRPVHNQTDQTERPMRAGHAEKLASRVGSGGIDRAGESPAAISHIQMVEETIEIRQGCNQRQIAQTYALALRSSWPTDWPRVNSAITAKWPKALERIKRMAWTGACFRSTT